MKTLSPECLSALKSCHEKLKSLSKTAKRIGTSPTAVSQLLSGKYGADVSKMEERIRTELLSEEIDCPALERIPLAECHQWREKAGNFAATDPLRTQMFKACNDCPKGDL
ncbi:MAG: hypothetical protein OQJ97_18630 [Rhodospirillales bacterium]|nr:hypothetical protein [Rhodospirillales bacterium]